MGQLKTNIYVLTSPRKDLGQMEVVYYVVGPALNMRVLTSPRKDLGQVEVQRSQSLGALMT